LTDATAATCGLGFPFDALGQPTGPQLVGRHGDAAGLLAIAAVPSKEMPWKGRRWPVQV